MWVSRYLGQGTETVKSALQNAPESGKSWASQIHQAISMALIRPCCGRINSMLALGSRRHAAS